MIQVIQRTKTIWILCLAAACSSVDKTYTSYSDWDKNNDQNVSRSEFVDAYLAQDYFDKWGANTTSIRYEDLFDEAFESLDSDADGKLSLVEFNSQMNRIYFGVFSESFESWDSDSNASISKTEFDEHVVATNLAKLWDTDDNKDIAEREMAGGMFYVCDSDSDGSVNETELNTWKRNRKPGAGGN